MIPEGIDINVSGVFSSELPRYKCAFLIGTSKYLNSL